MLIFFRSHLSYYSTDRYSIGTNQIRASGTLMNRENAQNFLGEGFQ